MFTLAIRAMGNVEYVDWAAYDTTSTVKTQVITTSDTLLNHTKVNFGVPYKPWIIDTNGPIRVEAEHYNGGGKMVGYYDTSAGNLGGKYRQDDVDIQQCYDVGGGYDVAWFGMNEWLNYSLSVTTPGWYVVKFRVANYLKTQGALIEITVNNRNTRGAYKVPVTGGSQKWKTFAIQDVFLPSGNITLTIRSNSGGFSINWFEIESQ